MGQVCDDVNFFEWNLMLKSIKAHSIKNLNYTCGEFNYLEWLWQHQREFQMVPFSAKIHCNKVSIEQEFLIQIFWFRQSIECSAVVSWRPCHWQAGAVGTGRSSVHQQGQRDTPLAASPAVTTVIAPWRSSFPRPPTDVTQSRTTKIEPLQYAFVMR